MNSKVRTFFVPCFVLVEYVKSVYCVGNIKATMFVYAWLTLKLLTDEK